MAETDVFSALNVGSGLNTSELIKNLVDAERAPKEEKINRKIETAEVSISAIAELKNTISDSNSVIKSLDGTEVFTGSSTNTAVSLKVIDPAKVNQMMSTVSVSQLAKSQTLVFDGFASATSNVGSGVINFQRGSWSNGVFTSDTKYNSVDVNIGDRVITSGFSKIYPPKLPVGTVSGVYDERGSYQKVVNVKIQNDFESIQNVFIVLDEK